MTEQDRNKGTSKDHLLSSHVIKRTAHSGCEGTKPNSIEYIECALQSECDVIELDIRKWKDQLLLSHDPLELQRKKYVTFEEAVKKICSESDKKINCDLKEDIVNEVLLRADQLGITDRLIFTGSVNTDRVRNSMLDHMKQIYINVESADCDLEQIQSTGAAGINIEYCYVTKELVDAVHRRNMQILVWTVETEADMKNMQALGVDGITSNKIKILTEIMRA